MEAADEVDDRRAVPGAGHHDAACHRGVPDQLRVIEGGGAHRVARGAPGTGGRLDDPRASGGPRGCRAGLGLLGGVGGVGAEALAT